MPFKLNISENTGKTYKLELENEFLVGKKLGEKVNGKEISEDLNGYELEISGATDFAGFPNKKDIEGPELKRVILKKGWGMKQKKKGLKKRKTLRGNQISDNTVQINMNVLKDGSKKLKDVFPDQNKPKEEEKKETPKSKEKTDIKPTERREGGTETEAKSEQIQEVISEEVKEEIKDDIPSSQETKTEKAKDQAAEKIAEEVKEEVEETAEKLAEKEEKK
jgi:small subunit ribosomal protein S6e